MQPMDHQMMGYDRAITMFSPDGRLLQVEYAKKTVKQGSTAIGMSCKDGVLLVTDKRIVDKLIIPDSVEKIWKIEDHIMITAAGIISDARVLIDRAQVRAQQHMVTYDSPIDILAVVRDLCNLKQICTQSGGLRPFGVSLLIAGIDNGTPKLYETDPTGIYFRYRATAIGEGENEIEEILYKDFKDTMTIDEGLKLSVNALKKVLEENIKPERIDAAFIKLGDNKFTKVTKKRIAELMK
ncbi:archaeal proteasome endopeptidase complex subunit alpha [archaeon]|jgi:proteasome alpha subunit|nr:archaeal proteasome endopeptidase complex subunit alpha [archaeon]MBT4648069.1 archaeal proteasome endopeptidase complex subunit alpha [archaeon]MBT6822507.1 archaeal proteasome endopeptidase complex subunit alpha [archaeon]MBT7392508.1 archaeal proteasome endopeptidase complex subunit alpha [archaeon]